MTDSMVKRVTAAVLGVIEARMTGSADQDRVAMAAAKIAPEIARAAIAAMREPTREMCTAMNGDDGGYKCDGHYVVGDPPVVWRRTIDAVLKE